MAFGMPIEALGKDQMVFDSPYDPSYEITLVGDFNAAAAVTPGHDIFAYKFESKKFRGKLYWLYQYDFAGRTGDKTFELRLVKREGDASDPRNRKESKISVYFDPEVPLPLDAMLVPGGLGARCAKGEVPKLRMLKLAGNELQFQVLLPECLKR